jgi:hypothetical protein
VGYGLIFTNWLSLVGGLVVAAGLYGWAFEPPDDPDAHDEGPDHEGQAPEGEGELPAGQVDEASEPDAPAADKEVETVG